MSDFPRAYLRMSPNLDQHPDPLGMVLAMCAAGRQTERGRFQCRSVAERVLGRKRTKEMIERHDIVVLADGRLYLEGWDEWQEGDITVKERMQRLRDRKRRQRDGSVTPRTSHQRNEVTTTADRETLSGSTSSGVGVGEIPPPPTSGGRRVDGTNPRANGHAPRDEGTNPRAQGLSPRQEREAQKRGGIPMTTAAILAAAAAAGRSGEDD